MKRVILLFSIVPFLSAQTVTQISNTSIVAIVGALECDWSGTLTSPTTLDRTCSLGGIPFSSGHDTFASSSDSNFGDAGPSVGTIRWLFGSIPTGGATYQITVSGLSAPVTGSFLLPVLPPMITGLLSETGTIGLPFTYQITATNSPTSYGASGLPNGLLLNTATGVISGTPSVVGTYPVSLSATNAGGTGTATLTIILGAPPPPMQITRLQTKSGAAGNSRTITITPTAPMATGDTVIVFVSCYYSGTANAGTWSVSDGANTYNSVALLVPSQQQMQAFVASAITGTAGPIVITSTVPTYWLATMLEYSGLGAFDKSAQLFDGNYETPYASGPLSTAQASELLLGAVHYNNSNTTSAVPDAPWTEAVAANDGAYQSQVIQEQIVGLQGSFNATGHLATAVPHSTMLIAVKGAQ